MYLLQVYVWQRFEDKVRRCHDAMVGRWEVGANNRGAVLRSRQHDFNTSILHISLITTVPIIRIMYSILP
jgi:hypothetical protein